MSQDRPEDRRGASERTEPGFEEGFDQEPDTPEELQVGRFSTGHEETPTHEPEKDDVGRFSEGGDRLPEHTPEKDRVGGFADSAEPDPAPKDH